MPEPAPESSRPAGEPAARLIVRMGWFVGLWLLGVGSLGGAVAVIHWALAPR